MSDIKPEEQSQTNANLPKVTTATTAQSESLSRDDTQEAFPADTKPAVLNGMSSKNDDSGSEDDHETFHDANDSRHPMPIMQIKPKVDREPDTAKTDNAVPAKADATATPESRVDSENKPVGNIAQPGANKKLSDEPDQTEPVEDIKRADSVRSTQGDRTSFPAITRGRKKSEAQVAEWSHQQLADPSKEIEDEEEEVQWQAMPAIDEYDIYDDDGRLVAKGTKAFDVVEDDPYFRLGGAGKGYTRVLLDEDARSTTSFDEDTEYLFKKPNPVDEKADEAEEIEREDEEQRDVLGQLQATKDLLTEGQRIAYVGVVRLTIYKMLRALDSIEKTRGTKKDFLRAMESTEMWGQQMMMRLYKHMEIDSAEQLMIEQLAEHGLEPADLAPPLMQNARVKNPLAETETSPKLDQSSRRTSLSQAPTVVDANLKESESVPDVHGVEEMPQTAQIDLDIRWTVLCDLFLVLISDSVYDARSRRLLERVASVLDINWTQICRFEKRVIDQLEMDEAAKENWDESEHMEERRKKGLKRKYMVMGLATVGGGVVIGLSAGLLAPVIGAGLAAGFTTIGITGTAGFLGGVGGAALITSAATAAGGTIAIRASSRRTGHVKTFEYRPLHNNKRLNLILTVSGWMTGKVDDVRLPFSTVDPIMGDIYSLLWEPEMLQTVGDTINILATEALTQAVQQVLGSTILVALMASLQLPIVLTKLAYLIDNPWTVSLDRANSAGLILADSLMARHLGQRPITLVGFSLGSRLIFSCLKELAARNAYGIIQNVYLFGSPIVAKRDEWLRARSVIAGRFVNGYASNDWILGYLFRATSGGIMRVAGLASVENVPGLENLDVTDTVKGHMAYRAAMPKLLRKLNWEVESDEFSEIEDPDPENYAQRQRELIQEIDEARKKAEEKPAAKRFGLFRRGKLAEKADWEKYQAKDAKKSPQIGSPSPDSFEQNINVLFDIDAIRKELISEQIEVRELKSTQPPMQFTTIKDGKKEIEYLRLHPDIRPDEVSKIKLPPRPSQVDDESMPAEPPSNRNNLSRANSAFVTSTNNPDPAQGITNNKTGKPSFEEYTFEEPKELVSTLPPLRLASQTTTTATTATTATTSPERPVLTDRPDLKTRDTEPWTIPPRSSSIPAAAAASTARGVQNDKESDGNSHSKNHNNQFTHTYTSPELEFDHNAWAEEGEVKMTFE